MKRVLLSLAFVICSLSLLPAEAGERVRERIFLSTDRSVYVAGDVVRLSAFCLDAAGGGFSNLSAVAYVELHNSSRMVGSVKVALSHGRGAGEIGLARDLPTGNYLLFAYTAAACGEEAFDPSVICPRVISVFNVSSSSRVPGGVVISEDAAPLYPGDVADEGLFLDVDVSGESPLVRLSAPQGGSVSVSVSRDDGIPAPDGPGLGDFPAACRKSVIGGFAGRCVPEPEGEIIRGRVVGLDPAQIGMLAGKCAFISVPGNSSDVFSSPVDNDGSVTFYTDNIFSSGDMVCEIEGLPSDYPGHIELDSPFVDWKVGDIPALVLRKSYADALSARGLSSVVESMFDRDEMHSVLYGRTDKLFSDEAVIYDLDDFTRFPSMEEVFTEIVPEVRVRKLGDSNILSVRVYDAFGQSHYTSGSSLVMLDGIPVFEHSRILEYDPSLVRSVKVYPYMYHMGERSFEGIVNLETYKGTAPSLTFGNNVRVVDFSGVSLPSVYSGVTSDGSYPDYRYTTLWYPILELASSEVSLPVSMPLSGGDYTVVAEGFSSDGRPVRAVMHFSWPTSSK